MFVLRVVRSLSWIMKPWLVIVSSLCLTSISPSLAQESFNPYILRAIDVLQKNYAGLGYNIKKAYTHNIDYDNGIIRASSPPETMCVAAVAEVVATAINLYFAETRDRTPYSHLPAVGWNRMRPIDIRSHIWVDGKLDSFGTADALETFGIGKRVRFHELTSGSFVNINRTNRSGHAVIFINFLDKDGNDISPNTRVNPTTVAGFKYYSAQGRNSHGLGYGYAFFSNKDGKSFCPALRNGSKPDCGVIFSNGQKLLNTGYMLHPKNWDVAKRDKNMKALIAGLYVQTRSRGPGALQSISPDLSLEDFTREIEDKDTMSLNPIFEVADE